MKVVRVDYEDITICDMDTSMLQSPMIVSEFGYLIEENEDYLWLIKDYYWGENEQKITVIPKGCIVGVIKYKEDI